MSRLDELHEIVKRLDSLLRDQNPGLFTWVGFLHGCLKEIEEWNHRGEVLNTTERHLLEMADMAAEGRNFCDKELADHIAELRSRRRIAKSHNGGGVA